MKKNRKSYGLVLGIAAILGCAVSTQAAHPEIVVTPADRDAIQAKVQAAPWAKTAYAKLKGNVDHYVALCQTDPDYLTSRLLMNWQTHYTQPVVKSERWVGGEGHAPVPTPRFAGARDWATKYHVPDKLEDYRPLNDAPDGSGKIWLIDSDTKEGGWVDPGLTGRTIEVANARILQIAADASFVYWLTGDDKYAAFAAHILWTYMDGFQYVQLPRDMTPGKASNPIIGMSSFEVIHEDSMQPLGLSYDFLHDYLVKQGTNVGVIQAQLKRLADRVIDGGSATGNWNMNQANEIVYAVMALDDDGAFPDHHGRQYYADLLLNARLPNQTGITHVIKEGYDAQTALWPEAPGYGFGTTPQLVQIASLLRSDSAGQAVLDDPFLTRSMLAQLEMLYPNGYSTGLGDTDNARVRADGLELMIAAARRRGDADTETRLTAALDREIASGHWDRSAQSGIVPLSEYVAELKPVASGSVSQSRTYFGRPLNIYFQRSAGPDPDHSLAAALYGTEGGHVQANGLAIELYGAGLIQGADPGRGDSYWTANHHDYYAQPPAHNTVIVGGVSNYDPYAKPQRAMTLTAAEPADGQAALSPDISFATGSFHYDSPSADQQRTLAVIRTGPKSGFYWDVFRSRAATGPTQFHDYLYHNIGQSLVLTDARGQALPLMPSSRLGSKQGDLKGYDYFQSEKSTDYAGDFHGTFTTHLPDGTDRQMGLWMLASSGRTVFSVAAPADHAGRTSLPASFQAIPMPTLLVRQAGDAWTHPFVTVYEPSLGTDGATIQNVRAAKVGPADTGLAACVVEGQTAIDGGKPTLFTVTLAQDDQSTGGHTVEGMTFRGRFGVVKTQAGAISEIYLGQGLTLGNGTVFVSSSSTAPVSAALYQDKGGWHYSASAPIKISLLLPLPSDASPTSHWRLVILDAQGHETPVSAQVQTVGQKSVSVRCVLPAGQDRQILLRTAGR